MQSIQLFRNLLEQQQYAALVDHCLQADMADPAIQVLLCLAYLHQGDRVAAQAMFEQSQAQADSMDAATRLDLVAVYMLLHQTEKAIDLVEEIRPAIEVTKDQALRGLLCARLGWCRMQQGKLREAKALFAQSADLYNRRIAVYLNLARLCLMNNPDQITFNSAEAQQFVDQAVTILQQEHPHWAETLVAQCTEQLRLLQLEIWVRTDELAQAESWLNEKRESIDEADWAGLIVGTAILLAGCDQHEQASDLLRESLRYYPKNIALHVQMAELAEVQGRRLQAIRILHRALRLAEQQDADTFRLRCRLAEVNLQVNLAAARTHLEKARDTVDQLAASDDLLEQKLRQHKLQLRLIQAQIESNEQNFSIADQLFREVLEENPYSIPALRGLGQQHMQLGEIDEAITLYERLKQVDPVVGHSALINARHFPENEAVLEKLDKAARMPSLQGSVKTGILFQLAAAWEKRKNYDKAFSYAHDANKLSRRFLHYDAKKHRNMCARIRYAFNKALYEHRQGFGINSTLPVFVLGMPRSGTTLAEQILSGHSKIYGAGELGIIPQRIQGLNRWERQVGSGRQYPDCVDDLSAYDTAGIANGIVDELQAMAAEEKPEAKFVVDKLPHNFESIGFIKFLFPNARIISVRRDPRDIALSNYFTDYQAKHGGMGFAYDLTDIGEQLADHNLLMQHWHQTFPAEILEINYEDVVDDLEGTARKMFDYIGVEWEDQVLSFNKLDRPVKTASVWQVRQPIYKTSMAKWKRYENHLSPLIKGTNTKIISDKIEMMTLPEPGMLIDGVSLYKTDKLDKAEYRFKQLLHHIPQHAAAHAMLGIIYAKSGRIEDAIKMMEQAHEKCPWNKNWRNDLIQAYVMAGETQKAENLKQKKSPGQGLYDDSLIAEKSDNALVDIDSRFETAHVV